jgi:hypothetical protein
VTGRKVHAPAGTVHGGKAQLFTFCETPKHPRRRQSWKPPPSSVRRSKAPPAHFRNGFHVVARKGQSKSRIHALVKEDAHSFICSPANSRKRCAWPRSKDGTVSRNSSSEKPAVRWSISICTGIRVPLKQGAPESRSGSTHTTSSNRRRSSGLIHSTLQQTGAYSKPQIRGRIGGGASGVEGSAAGLTGKISSDEMLDYGQ